MDGLIQLPLWDKLAREGNNKCSLLTNFQLLVYHTALNESQNCEHLSKYDRYHYLFWHTYYTWKESRMVWFSPHREMNKLTKNTKMLFQYQLIFSFEWNLKIYGYCLDYGLILI